MDISRYTIGVLLALTATKDLYYLDRRHGYRYPVYGYQSKSKSGGQGRHRRRQNWVAWKRRQNWLRRQAIKRQRQLSRY